MSRRSWQLERRSFLKGIGVACALPYLECMGTAAAAKKADVPKRLCFVYFPNGVGLPPAKSEHHKNWNWFPLGEGKDYKFTNVLSSLEPHRDKLSILGELSHPFSRKILGHAAGDTWLTGGDIRGNEYNNSVSIDQIAAREFSRKTRYPSFVLSTDGGVGYKSRVCTLSFNSSGRPLPSEHRHREIFERYFSPNGGSSSQARRKQLQQDKKIVDLILEDSKSLHRKLGHNDKEKMDEYLTSLNSVEEQVRRNERWMDVPMKTFESGHLNFDVNAAVDPQSYIRTMLDLMVLGFQTDVTRVMTYMLAREDGMGFGENFPKLVLGLKKGHHTISHDKADGHWKEWGNYDKWLASQFAYFVDRMKNTSDEHGPLLDNSLLLYGSACSSTHNAVNYPLVLAGGANMGVKHGTYTKFSKKVPMSNLFVSMLNALDVKTEKFSDSTGPLEKIFT